MPWPPQVQLSLAASKLENKDTWGKSDPFVRISKARANGAWFPVLKSEASFGCPLWLLSFLCLLVMSRWSRQSYCRQPACLISLRRIHKTPTGLCACAQVVDNNLSPTWKQLKASMASLCNCDESRPLLLEVVD